MSRHAWYTMAIRLPMRCAIAVVGILFVVACGRQEPTTIGNEGNGNAPVADLATPQKAPAQQLEVSNYAIQYFPPSERDMQSQAIFEDENPFFVSEYGPKGLLPDEALKPSIYVVFSQPVVPISVLGRPVGQSDIVSISPHLGGVYRWYGTRLLSFDTDDEVLPQREYTITVSAAARSLGGKVIQGNRQFTFRTKPLTIKRIYPGGDQSAHLADVPPDDARTLTVLFSYPVNVAVVRRYIEITVGGESVDFAVDRESPVRLEEADRRSSAVLHLSHEIPEQTEMQIILKAGARSEEGYAGSLEDTVVGLSTIGPFEFMTHSTYSDVFPSSGNGPSYPVYLEFSHPVNEIDIDAAIRTVPVVEVAAGSITARGNQIMIDDLPFPPESSFTIILDGSLEDIYGRALSKAVEVSVTVPEARRYARFPNTGARILESVLPPRIIFEYQNVFEGVWKIGRMADPYGSFQPHELVPYDFSNVQKNTRYFEEIAINPWLNIEGKGTVGISWNFSKADRKGSRPVRAQENLQLQVTDLAITTRVAYNRIIVLVSSLSGGKPVQDADVSLMRGREIKLRGTTDGAGLVIFELENGDYNRHFQDLSEDGKDHLRIRAAKGLDSVEFVPNYSHDPSVSGVYSVRSPLATQRPRIETLLFTDRGLYRPDERVWFRGIDLDMFFGEYAAYRGSYTVELREPGRNGKTLDMLEGRTTRSGGFFGSFDLSSRLDPGYYVIGYSRDDEHFHQVSFQVAHYRRAKFQPLIQMPETTWFLGDSLRFSVTAEYLAGGVLSGQPYVLHWSKTPTQFSPPGNLWSEMRFGPLKSDQRHSLSMDKGTLSAAGSVRTEQHTTEEGVSGKPYDYQLEARIRDTGSQEIVQRLRALVHPASFYIGARLSSSLAGSWSSFVAKGEDVSVSWVMVRPDGSRVERGIQDRVLRGELYRADWKISQQQGVSDRVGGRYQRVEELIDSVLLTTQDTTGGLSFRPGRAGSHIIRLYSEDEHGRAVVTSIDFYVTGADWIRWSGEGGEISLVPDDNIYAPGETATVLVKSPLPKGTYLVTVEKDRIHDQHLVQLEGSAQIIGIPIRAEHVPIVYVSVASYSVRTGEPFGGPIGEPTRTYFSADLDKPKGYYGVVPLNVDISSRKIDLEIDTGGITYLPGGEAEIAIIASQNGRPVSGAEVTFLAVDRGVVDLIDYHIPDPLEYFYSPYRFPLGVTGADSRSLLIDPATYDVRNLSGGDTEDAKAGGIRRDFVPTAVFEPLLVTDDEGIARVRFTLPDTLTTYRCTALSSRGQLFGHAEAELRVQQPINVTALLPRSMRVRDTVTAGVIVTNMDRETHNVTVGLVASAVEIHGESSHTTQVEPGQSKRVDFTLLGTQPGTAILEFQTQSAVMSERLEKILNVRMPLIKETFTSTGRTEADADGVGSALESLILPGGEKNHDGRLIIQAGPAMVSGLNGAVAYLLAYPHGSFEQRASRLVPLVAFGDLAAEMGAPIPDVHSEVERELQYWKTFQLSDGAFPFRPDGEYRPSYYVTLRIAHILKLSEKKGYSIPAEIDQKKMLGFLATPEDWVARSSYLSMYSLYVQSLYGEPVARQAEKYANQTESLNIGSIAFLGLTFAELGDKNSARSMLEMIMQYVRPETRSIDLTARNDVVTSFYDSNTERLALLLLLAVSVDPELELIDRVAGSLLQSRAGGRWGNTTETQWSLLALSSLAGSREEISPVFVGSIALDSIVLSDRQYSSAVDFSRVALDFDDPIAGDIPRDTAVDLEFVSGGGGNLYYSASLSYFVPAELSIARDEGLTVFSAIEELDGTEIKGNILSLGKTYRQRVILSTAIRRTYVALTAPVPSGAEITDTSIAATGSHDEWTQPENSDMYQPPVEQIFDDRVVYYLDRVAPGRIEIAFLFRATTAGVFPTPPTQAECMYEPEVFGRSDGRLYIIR